MPGSPNALFVQYLYWIANRGLPEQVEQAFFFGTGIGGNDTMVEQAFFFLPLRIFNNASTVLNTFKPRTRVDGAVRPRIESVNLKKL